MHRILTTGLLALALAPAFAGTYYVAPTGKTANTGTATSPWPTVDYALSKVGGGHTIIVKPGNYGTIDIYNKPGTAARPTVIKSEAKWKAVVRATGTYGIRTSGNASYVVIDGFRVMGSQTDGIYLNGAYNTVRNCWVHGNTGQGISSHGFSNVTIENNVVEFNGINPKYDHGIYADGDRLTIRNNIVRNNSGNGMQLYPNLSNSLVYNNVVYNHIMRAGILIESGNGIGRNRVFNNTSVNNAGGVDVRSGYYEVVANNILTPNNGSPISQGYGTTGTTVVNNITTGDPKFVSIATDNYYLRADSPAVNYGSATYIPPTDFFGRAMGTSRPDAGAYQYDTVLASSSATSTWYNGYPYHRKDSDGYRLPDFWLLP